MAYDLLKILEHFFLLKMELSPVQIKSEPIGEVVLLQEDFNEEEDKISINDHGFVVGAGQQLLHEPEGKAINLAFLKRHLFRIRLLVIFGL